jgi:hypothetical protein
VSDEDLFDMLNMPSDAFFDAIEGYDTYRGFGPEDWVDAMNDTLEDYNQTLRVTDAKEGEDYMYWRIASAPKRKVVRKKKAKRDITKTKQFQRLSKIIKANKNKKR